MTSYEKALEVSVDQHLEVRSLLRPVILSAQQVSKQLQNTQGMRNHL
jgi:hypothetical protein